jgi:threonylcarbamoyladenosine tRNA methylthiotransferase MtaB
MKERMQRSEMLRILSEKKRRAFYAEHIGTVRPVLFEQEEKQGFMYGFTDNYIRVKTQYDPLLVNEIREAELGQPDADGDLYAVENPAFIHTH